jgi:hypothetical protein
MNETRFYQKDGFYWMVKEGELIQFADAFYLPWKPGTEMFGYKVRELSKTPPMGYKEGLAILKTVNRDLDELIKELEAA